MGLGVRCGEVLLALLMFADNIALLAKTEQELQTLLDCLYSWYNTWLLHISTSKSKVVHIIMPKSQIRSSFNFKCSPFILDTVPFYKYLGVNWLSEHLEYQSCIKPLHVADSGRKALGLLISKSKQFGSFPFDDMCLAHSMIHS